MRHPTTRTEADTQPFEEQFIEQYKLFRTYAGEHRATNPYHRALHDPMWFLLPVLKLPIYLWFFTSGQVDLPILQDPFTRTVLFAAIIFFHSLWFAMFFAGLVWEHRRNRRAYDS